MPDLDPILRLPDVVRVMGRRKTAIYGDVKASVLTKPVPLGGRAVGWPTSEIDAINRARVAGVPDSELRSLVVALHSARRAALEAIRDRLPETKRGKA